jgi:hypothetical protein
VDCVAVVPAAGKGILMPVDPVGGREAETEAVARGLVCSCGWYSTRDDRDAARRHIVQSPGGIHDVVREAEDAEEEISDA